MKLSSTIHRAFLCGTLAFAVFVGFAPIAHAGSSTSVTTSSTNKAARVNVNSADLETLQTLPGVGPAIAQRIIDGRPYKSYSDLENVKGLSKSKVDAMKGQVNFGSATTAKSGKTIKIKEGEFSKIQDRITVR